MPRYFTVEQATALLPRVERHLRDALFARTQYTAAEDAFREIQKGILMAGGSIIDREKVTRVVAQKGAASMIFQQELAAVDALGVQVKDLEIGLIDFPTRFRGQVVLLCWRFGEESISHWHGVTEGFRGRKLIDEEFLASHSGESDA